MADSKPSINLLPDKNTGFLAQFLNWSLSIGRLLIILTETAALATFLYRFGLDMQIVDLHDKIKAQGSIVKNFKTSEDNFRNLQDRLSLARNYDDLSGTIPKIFIEVADIGRGKVVFNSLSVSTDSIKIEAQAPSADLLSQFANDLRNYPSIKSVNVDNIKNSTTNALVTIGITAQLKTSKNLKP